MLNAAVEASAFLPFETERLTVRAMRPSDAEALAAYRNDPGVARYQDWELPFTPQMARRLIAAMDGISAPVPNEWVQMAIEDRDGALVGDLAVYVDTDVRVALIGYTLAAAHHGRGYATEAAGALVDRLFGVLGVHRVAATLDPENTASARLLERLGFRYEGRGRGAAYVRGGWADDDRYAILADERREWLLRPHEPPATVDLVEITRGNIGRVTALATHRSQQQFVATIQESFIDAFLPEVVDGRPLVPWLRAIEADGDVVGFVMLAIRTDAHPEAFLWRFLVDARHQRRGIGRRALHRVAEHLLAGGDEVLQVSWVEGPGGPADFYLRLGFVPTGEIVDGETLAAIALTQLIAATADRAEV